MNAEEREGANIFLYKVGFTVLNIGRFGKGKKQMVLNEKIDG